MDIADWGSLEAVVEDTDVEGIADIAEEDILDSGDEVEEEVGNLDTHDTAAAAVDIADMDAGDDSLDSLVVDSEGTEV
mgnify:FL=1